jgi:phospholipid/cholesterol/gamma-HCH transport system permease protein
MTFVARLGQYTIDSIAEIGAFWRFAARTIVAVFLSITSLRTWRLVIPQFYEVGNRTVPVILVTGTFVGLVLAVSGYMQLRDVGLEQRLGAAVALSVIPQLGPVLAGGMVAGRVGGALTAELGTMNVTEQIDALRSMGSDPIRYLVVPRFLACLLLTPLLTWYCDGMAMLGSAAVALGLKGIESGPYWEYFMTAVAKWDLFDGTIKSLAFGGVIGLTSCYKGFTCGLGAEGVGRACTESFVVSFIAILILDFFITVTMQSIYVSIWGFKTFLTA